MGKKEFLKLAVIALLGWSLLVPCGCAFGQQQKGDESSDSQLRLLASSGDKGKFLEALRAFVKQQPDNADRLAYAASLADVAGANLTAIEFYCQFKKRFPRDSRLERIEQLIKRLQEEESECPEAFVDATPEDDFFLVDTIRKHVIRWTPARMPIRVCIHQGAQTDATPPEFLSLSKQLFNDWSAASGGVLQFAFVNDVGSADIDVLWTRDRSKSPLPGKQGVTTYEWKNSSVDKAKIVCLSVRFLSDALINAKSARHVIIHEIGHALGLGHSKNIHDCMYFGNMTPEDEAAISDNDRRMLRQLYSTSDEELQAAALACATKYGGPQKEMIAPMLRDWADVATIQGDFKRAEGLLHKQEAIFERMKGQVPADDLFQNARDLARVLRQQDKFAQAIPYYLACAEHMKLHPSNEEDLITVLQNLAACQRASDRYADCKITCLQLMPILARKKPDSDAMATLIMQLGTLSYNDRQFAQAEQYYQQACDIYQKLHSKTNEAQMAAENHQIAVKFLNSAVYKDKIELPFPGKGTLHDWYKGNDLYKQANRLMSQRTEDKLEGAVAKYKEAISIYPYDCAYYFNLANALMRLRRSSEAAANYEKATELNPESFSMMYWYGVASYSDKKFEQAKAAFLKASSIQHSTDDQKELQRYLDNLSVLKP